MSLALPPDAAADLGTRSAPTLANPPSVDQWRRCGVCDSTSSIFHDRKLRGMLFQCLSRSGAK